MAHFNFVISQNAKLGHAGFYIDCHRMTVPENILLQKKALVVQQRVYHSQVHNVDDLKEPLVQVWNDMDHSIVNSAVDQWRQRLRACVWTKGGHFEQLL